MSYISREAAIEAIMSAVFSINFVYGRSERGMAAAKEAVRVLKDLPSADVVEVIRCKDCKSFIGDDKHEVWGYDVKRAKERGKDGCCESLMYYDGDGGLQEVNKNHFCGYAERRTDGEIR